MSSQKETHNLVFIVGIFVIAVITGIGIIHSTQLNMVEKLIIEKCSENRNLLSDGGAPGLGSR